MRISTTATQVFVLTFAAATFLSADTLTLRSGQIVQGTFLGGTARQVRMELNGETRTYDLTDVTSISFSDQSSQASPAPRYTPPPPAQTAGDSPRLRRQAENAPASITIPIDTQVTIRMIDAVDSERARTGQTFRASLDEPIVVNGQEVVPRGADVLTKLVDAQQSGKIQGRAVLTLALSTIDIKGRPVEVTSTDVSQASGSRGARSAKVVGGTAALGAIIGAIAGGGKGAAIGAGSGAAVGAGAEVLTDGQKVRIPSETRLVFRLQNPVQL